MTTIAKHTHKESHIVSTLISQFRGTEITQAPGSKSQSAMRPLRELPSFTLKLYGERHVWPRDSNHLNVLRELSLRISFTPSKREIQSHRSLPFLIRLHLEIRKSCHSNQRCSLHNSLRNIIKLGENCKFEAACPNLATIEFSEGAKKEQWPHFFDGWI